MTDQWLIVFVVDSGNFGRNRTLDKAIPIVVDTPKRQPDAFMMGKTSIDQVYHF